MSSGLQGLIVFAVMYCIVVGIKLAGATSVSWWVVAAPVIAVIVTPFLMMVGYFISRAYECARGRSSSQ